MQHSVDEFENSRNNHLLSIAKKKVVRIVAIFLIWALVITYMCLPISKMQGISISGNVFISDSKLIDIACIDSRTFRWDFDEDEAKKMINSYTFGDYSILSDAKVKNNLLSVSVEVKETFPLVILGEHVLLSDVSKMAMDRWFSVVPAYYQEAVGHLPELNIAMLSENSLDDFVKFSSRTSEGYVELRNKVEVLSVSNIELEASPEDEVYVYSFKEVRSGIVYEIDVLVSPSRISSKLTYDFYNDMVNNAINRADSSGVESTLYEVTVDYVGSWIEYTVEG